MILVPKSLSRLGHRSFLKLNASSPTILVIAGVVGLGATAVLAAKASRKVDPILDAHKQARGEIGYVKGNRDHQGQLLQLYLETGTALGKLYGPTIFVGTCSAISVLGGHKILHSRQVATMAAYSSLVEQFRRYRGRVIKTLGEDMERSIFEGAHGEWVEDEDHKGEYKLKPKFEPDKNQHYLRPWFDEYNVNWTRDPLSNYLFLKGVQQHMNNILQIRGHVFLNDVYDALNMERRPEGAVAGWVRDSATGDGIVDFGFMTSTDPQVVAFKNHAERSVRLNFNIDGVIWDLI